MQNWQKEISPALREGLNCLRNCLLELADEVGGEPIENAKKMELLCSILQQAGFIEREEDKARFTDLRAAAKEVERFMGIES